MASINKISKPKEVFSGQELFNSLPESTKIAISKSNYSKEDWISWNKKMREKNKKKS